MVLLEPGEKNRALKVVAILQARMGSSRLPGKILKKVLGRELLSFEIERIRRCQTLDECVVATTTLAADDQVVDLCYHLSVNVFRGDSDDVLDRYNEAAKQHSADVIVRVTGDCPLIDPEIVDHVVEFYIKNFPAYDYVSNTRKLSYPRGLDVEVFSRASLEAAAENAKTPYEREHVTPYIYLHPEQFKIGNIECKKDLSTHRWTVDTQEDFNLVEKIITDLYPRNPNFHMNDILELLNQHPDWLKINAHIKQKE